RRPPAPRRASPRCARGLPPPPPPPSPGGPRGPARRGAAERDGPEPRRRRREQAAPLRLPPATPQTRPASRRRIISSVGPAPSQGAARGNLRTEQKQPGWGKPRPRPGDLIEIFRIGYEHWAIYVEDDCVVHLAPPSEEFEAGSITSVFSNRAVVKYSRLEDVLHGCSWKINNKLDGTYLPLPVDKIIQRTKKMINKIVQYSLIEGNCEHFVNDLRYGVARSQQVEHALMEGAKAAGAVISAVVESIRPKPVTA
uniref:Phospholipase A and acyltransferase 5 n=1 Tax=Canis lupus familiaris TaxID=9615 RepID=A0A8P0NGR8_CANLF